MNHLRLLKSGSGVRTCPGPTRYLWHHSAHAEILCTQRWIGWDDGILRKCCVCRDLVQDRADFSVRRGVFLDELAFAPEYGVVDNPLVIRLQKLLYLFFDVVNLLPIAHVFEIVRLICVEAICGIRTHVCDAAKELVDLVYVINLGGILTAHLRLHQSRNAQNQLGRV